MIINKTSVLSFSVCVVTYLLSYFHNKAIKTKQLYVIAMYVIL